MKAREESKGEVWKRDSSSRPLRNKREDDSFLDRCCSNDPQTRQLSVSKDGRVSFLLEIVHDREREECRPPSQPEGPFDSFITSVITQPWVACLFYDRDSPPPRFRFRATSLSSMIRFILIMWEKYLCPPLIYIESFYRFRWLITFFFWLVENFCIDVIILLWRTTNRTIML